MFLIDRSNTSYMLLWLKYPQSFLIRRLQQLMHRLFYFLELLVGIVQALVFTLLTAVFTSLMTSAHGNEEHGHEGSAHNHH